MKIAIVISCLLAFAAARNLKREDSGSNEVLDGAPVSKEDGKKFIAMLLEFGGQIHDHIQGLDAEAAAMLEGKDWKESAKVARQIINELSEADHEARKIFEGYGKGLENLMYHGVEGMSDCHKLAGILHYLTGQAQDAGDSEEFWGTYLKVVRGNAVCVSGRFAAFGGYLEWLQKAMDGGQETQERHSRSLDSLLRELEKVEGKGKGNGNGAGSAAEGPHPTGDGEDMFAGMSDEEIGKHLYETSAGNFEIEAHAVVVGFGMKSLHGWVSFFVGQLHQVVPEEEPANRQVDALRQLLLKARVLNNAMNENMHLLR